MTIEQRIRQKLEQEFQPTFLKITNDSALHSGHIGAGQETHFTIEMVSDKFSGKSRLERHRMVNSCLSEELRTTVHALAMKLKSPQEL